MLSLGNNVRFHGRSVAWFACMAASLARAEALVTCFFIDTPKDIEELFRVTWPHLVVY